MKTRSDGREHGLMDLGLAGLCCAGVESTQNILGKGSIGLDVVLPSTVMTQIGIVDSNMTAFNAEALTVGDVSFLTGWNAFKNEWDTFKAKNDSQLKIVSHFPSTVLSEVNQFKSNLIDWRTKFASLTGKVPASPGPTAPPQPPTKPDTSWSTSTWILLGLMGALVVGGAGYATYKYAQTAKRSTARGKKFLEGEMTRGLTPGSRAMKLALADD